MKTKIVFALAVAATALTVGPAEAQLQPGPNISPNGYAGYLGPPAAIFPFPFGAPLAYAPPPPIAGPPLGEI